jgi:hypothetical protein
MNHDIGSVHGRARVSFLNDVCQLCSSILEYRGAGEIGTSGNTMWSHKRYSSLVGELFIIQSKPDMVVT